MDHSVYVVPSITATFFKWILLIVRSLELQYAYVYF